MLRSTSGPTWPGSAMPTAPCTARSSRSCKPRSRAGGSIRNELEAMDALKQPHDLPALLELLGTMGPGLFGEAPLLLSRAPGRLDVMGGFADYSGSLTLELPIAEGTYVAAQPHVAASNTFARLEVVSAGFGPGAGPTRRASFPLSELRAATQSYASARDYFQRDRSSAWAAYVAGVYAAL